VTVAARIWSSARIGPLLIACAIVACASGGATIRDAAVPERRPNILFIFADDWGWGDLSLRGNPHVRTPHLDSLVREGLDLRQFTVASPVCSPSRAAVLTGRYPARLSIHEHFWSHEKNRERDMPDWLDPELVNLPRLLQQSGYVTGHFGKWHLSTQDRNEDAPLPERYGFDEARVWSGPGPQTNPRAVYDDLIDFMRRNGHQPFFANLWLHEPHINHRPQESSLELFGGEDERHRIYAAVIADADAGIGRVLQALEELGLEEDTLVIFSSDNGPEMQVDKDSQRRTRWGYGAWYNAGSTGGLRGRKRSLYEGGIRVPLLVRWPGKVPAGSSSEEVVTAVDLLPTFCAAAGVPLPEGYQPDGENRLDVLRGKAAARAAPIFWEWRGEASADNWPRLAIRQGSWKLLMDRGGARRELYDLSSDREEKSDRADEHPDILRSLTAELQAWQDSLP